jgi:hypothetical protein
MQRAARGWKGGDREPGRRDGRQGEERGMWDEETEANSRGRNAWEQCPGLGTMSALGGEGISPREGSWEDTDKLKLNFNATCTTHPAALLNFPC